MKKIINFSILFFSLIFMSFTPAFAAAPEEETELVLKESEADPYSNGGYAYFKCRMTVKPTE